MIAPITPASQTASSMSFQTSPRSNRRTTGGNRLLSWAETSLSEKSTSLRSSISHLSLLQLSAATPCRITSYSPPSSSRMSSSSALPSNGLGNQMSMHRLASVSWESKVPQVSNNNIRTRPRSTSRASGMVTRFGPAATTPLRTSPSSNNRDRCSISRIRVWQLSKILQLTLCQLPLFPTSSQ